jgi:hypothetical protein
MIKRALMLLSCSVILLSSCGETALTGNTALTGTFASQFTALSPDQQTQFAKATGSIELLNLANDPTNAAYIAAANALATQRPELLNLVQNPGQNGPGGGMPPGGFGGPGGGIPGGPGGLPPNAEELRIQYPEFIAALEAMQDLAPEDRRAAMEALFTEHPEWQSLMPTQPAGGPNGGARPPQGGVPPQGPASPPPTAA